MTAALRGFNSAIRKTYSLIIDSVKAFSVQEQAIAGLEGALIGLGKTPAQIDALTKSFSKLAAAIQDETGQSDEATLAMITQLTQLGVLENQMDQAARAVVALKSVGMEQQAAMKAVSMAIQGNYSMLQRYVPALRDATSEGQKAKIVNDLLSATYAQQQKQLNTVAGGWAAFKGRIGDTMELIGGAIVRGLRLGETLAGLNEKLRNIGDSPKFQAFLARVQQGTTFIRELVDAMASGKTVSIIQSAGSIIVAAFKDGIEIAISALIEGVKYTGALMGALIVNGIKKGLSDIPVFKAFKIIANSKEDQSQPASMPSFNFEKVIKNAGRAKDEVRELQKLIKQVENGDSAGGADGTPEGPLKFDVVKPKELPDMVGPMKEQIAGLQDQEAEWKKIGAALDENIEKVEKQIEQNKELAGLRVADFLVQKKKDDEGAKAAEDEAKRIERLRQKEERGTKLSKQDREFLEGAKAIEAAKIEMDKQQKALLIMKEDAAIAKENADKANKAVADGFNDLNGMLKQLLVAPEG
jgi:hypothetical protein